MRPFLFTAHGVEKKTMRERKQKEIAAYLNREQAAQYLSVSVRTISELQKRRAIPVVRIARKCVRYPISGLDAFAGKFTEKAVA
jgi:excisionase family DNA binding protein